MWLGQKRKSGLKFSVLLIILCSVFFIIGCGGKSSEGQSNFPVKLGLLVPYSGVSAGDGYNFTRGAELYFDEIKWRAGGREIILIKEDSEMDSQVGLQKTRRLIECKQADILIGVVSSAVANTIRDYVADQNIPFIIANAGVFANGQNEYPLGKYAYEKMSLKKITILASDDVDGREKANGFIAGFKEAGGEIIQEIYPKPGTADFGPYLINLEPADAVWVHFSENDSAAFIKQYDEYGLKNIMPLLSSGDTVDESALPALGDSAIGIVSAFYYSANLNTIENTKFVNAYKAKYGEKPCVFAEQGYVAARVIAESLNAVKANLVKTQKLFADKKPNIFAEQGYLASRLIVEVMRMRTDNIDITDAKKLLPAISKVEFEAPRGPLKFEPHTQNVVFNTYIRRIDKKDGKLVYSVIDTIPEVSDSGLTLSSGL